MQWYYAESDDRLGPVSEEEFKILVSTGKIRTDTLVWNLSLSDWQEYGRVSGNSGSGADTGGADRAFCSECGKSFSRGDMIHYGDSWVCASCKPVFVQKIKEGVTVSGLVQYAGFWIRFGAKIIDWIIIGVFNMLINIPLGLLIGFAGAKPARAIGFSVLIQIVNFGSAVVYTTFFLGRFSATPGKMACKLKVVTPAGGRISYLRGFARYFGELVSGITLSMGYIMAAFDDEKRALHDRICNTRVIKSR